MNADLAQELLDELGSSLEELETEHGALMQFLKDNLILTDEQFAPYVTQAGKASSVRWRAARIRLDSLISTEKQKEESLVENGRRRADQGQAPVQNQEHDAKTENGAESGTAAPQALEGGPVEGTREVSNSEENGKQVEPVTSEKESSKTAS